MGRTSWCSARTLVAHGAERQAVRRSESTVPAAGSSHSARERPRLGAGRRSSDPNRVRVFVASEVRVYRAGLSRLVANGRGLELAGAGKAPECPARSKLGQPDVVLIDVTEYGAPRLPEKYIQPPETPS